jgi:hypothetical protein
LPRYRPVTREEFSQAAAHLAGLSLHPSAPAPLGESLAQAIAGAEAWSRTRAAVADREAEAEAARALRRDALADWREALAALAAALTDAAGAPLLLRPVGGEHLSVARTASDVRSVAIAGRVLGALERGEARAPASLHADFARATAALDAAATAAAAAQKAAQAASGLHSAAQATFAAALTRAGALVVSHGATGLLLSFSAEARPDA